MISKSACLMLLGNGIFFAVVSPAQSRQSSSPPSNPAPALNEQQRAGNGLFLQNCSLCHLPKMENVKNAADPGNTIGPVLCGLFGGAKPVGEQIVRTFILQGVQRKMPRFHYGLEPKETDNIIA